MRIQNIMRVVGQVLITLALFILVPFFFGILDEGIGYYSIIMEQIQTPIACEMVSWWSVQAGYLQLYFQPCPFTLVVSSPAL